MSFFENCIETAVAQGQLSREDADAILERYRSDKKILGSPKAEEAGEIAWKMRAKIARLDAALTRSIDNQMLKDFNQYRNARGLTNLREAMMAKFESDGYSGYPGVKQIGESYIGVFNAQVADALETFRRKFVSGKRQNASLMVELRKGLHGERVSPEIKALADQISKALEFMRTESNKYGGHIPKLENWGVPQSHDENAVGNAKMMGHNGGPPLKTTKDHLNAWRQFIGPLLDWSKMFDPITGEKFDTAGLTDDRKASILQHAFYSIVTEGRNDLIPAMRPKGLGFGGAREQHRFFIFKDAAAQEKYDREYGKGDVFTQIMSYGHSMAREIALKRVFGPNPPARIEWMKQLFAQHVGKQIQGLPNLLGAYAGKTPPYMRSLDEKTGHLLDAYYDQFRGEASTSNGLSIAATIIGNVQMGALLGSSVIPHAMSNWYIQMLERKILHVPMARTIPSLMMSFSKASHAEMLRAGLAIEDGAFNVGQGARQLAAWHRIANASRLLPDRTTTWSGLQKVVDANKASFQKDLMGYVADNLDKPFAKIEPFLRRKLAGYGIDARTWQLFQIAERYAPAPGAAPWLRWKEIADAGVNRPDHVLRISGEGGLPLIEPGSNGQLYVEARERAQQIAFDAAVTYLNFLHGEREVAVPQSSARARAFLIGKSDKSSWLGVLRASTGMFKGFIGSMTMTQLHALQRETGRGWQYGAAHAMSLFLGLTVLGMMSLQLKQMAAGKDPMSMNPLNPFGRLAWARAALTGGSFGLLGDLLASEHDSYGHGWAENLMGPMVNLPADLAIGTYNLGANALAGKRQKVPMSVALERELIKVLRNNMPVLTTHFLTRAAYQRIFVDQIEHAIDPEANRLFKEQERNTMKNYGQSYYWKPGEMLPDRFPDFGAALK